MSHLQLVLFDVNVRLFFNFKVPPLKVKDDPHFSRQFDQKEQQPPSMDASHESLLTMTSRATQHAGNIVDSHSATTSASIHDATLLFISGSSGSVRSKFKTISIMPGSASSQLSETTIVGIEQMVLPREDALLSSKIFSQGTSIFEKMMKIHGHGKFFLFI